MAKGMRIHGLTLSQNSRNDPIIHSQGGRAANRRSAVADQIRANAQSALVRFRWSLNFVNTLAMLTT